MKKNWLSFIAIAIFGIATLTVSCKGEEKPKEIKKEFTVKTDKATYSGGESVIVTFKADTSWVRNAWIGIIPSEVEHGKEYINDNKDIAYKYLERKGEGTLKFTVPGEPGSYDIRMNDCDNGKADGSIGKEVHSVTFTVK